MNSEYNKYYTPNLFENTTEKKFYYKSEKNKLILLNEKNWFKYMSEYGWTRLSKKWIRRFNKHLQNYKISTWGVLDCTADGDCLFCSIAEAMGMPYGKEIREIVADAIDDNMYETMIECYRIEYENDIENNVKEYMNNFNPYEIKNKEELKEKIKEMGNIYWGDYFCLQLIQKVLNINFIILWNEKCKFYNPYLNFNTNNKTIILNYINNNHFQLIGKFIENEMVSLFNEIPSEIYSICREDKVY